MAACQEDPLNQTLKFDAELKFQRPKCESEIKSEVRVVTNMTEDESEGEKPVRRGVWQHKAPQTLLNALANMEVSSICSSCSSTQGKWGIQNINTPATTVNKHQVCTVIE